MATMTIKALSKEKFQVVMTNFSNIGYVSMACELIKRKSNEDEVKASVDLYTIDVILSDQIKLEL